MKRIALIFATVSLFAFSVQTAGATTLANGTITRISLSTTGSQTDGATSPTAVNANGRFVVVASSATNLITGDTNAHQDIFVFDRQTGLYELISKSTAGALANGNSLVGTISADGRYVTFTSDATNLVAGDTNGVTDVFLRDRTLQTTTRLSVSTSGTEANAASVYPSISDDGNFVVFDSAATNLDTNDTNGHTDVFIRNVSAGTTTLVSAGTGGHGGNGDSQSTRISGNGRYVAFTSAASDLSSVTDSNSAQDVYRWDRTTNQTLKISQANDGTAGNGDSSFPFLSRDGSVVTYDTIASNIVTPDNNGTGNDVVVATVGTGSSPTISTQFVDVRPTGGNPTDGTSSVAPVDALGRFVAFTSTSTNLMSGNDTAHTQIYVRDTKLGTTTRLSANSTGVAGDDSSQTLAISPDGRTVAIGSLATNLVIGDTNAVGDTFLRQISGEFGDGYVLVGSDGGVFTKGGAVFAGSTGSLKLNKPIVGIAATPTGNGYWLVASDGGVFTFGDATFYGSTGALKLNKPIVGMAATPSGKGYWLVASDGGVFTFGDATFYGSTGALKLNKPVVAMAATQTGAGYWLVASDGGVFTFGDATFYGSTGAAKLNKPIVSAAAGPFGNGYWLVASDGGVFTFGDATFYGSTGALKINKPIVGLAPTATGNGYWLVASDGGIFSFGDATFFGSLGSATLNKPIVGFVAH